MIPVLRRCTLLMTVLSAACGDDCPDGDGGFGFGPDEGTIPLPVMEGIFEGREAAPFGPTADTYPWWQFDVLSSGGSSGTFATDLAFHQNRSNADTLRGTFKGVVCHARTEIEWEFELRYPEATYPCSLSGKISGHFVHRIDGVIGCTFDDHTTIWKAIYLEREPPPDVLGSLPQTSATRVVLP
jgi:hypothetical protein